MAVGFADFTVPATAIALPISKSFSVMVVLPASGWEIMAKVRRFATSAAWLVMGNRLAGDSKRAASIAQTEWRTTVSPNKVAKCCQVWNLKGGDVHSCYRIAQGLKNQR
jgi:hypothetical protein